MSQFGRNERALARILSDYPRAKRLAKWLYARAAFILYGRGPARQCKHELHDFGSPNVESFFGYYDKSPAAPDGEHLLWHETTISTAARPDPRHPIAIILADAEGREKLRLATRAYNWQQGARLQWLGADCFAFNDYDSRADRYVARLVSARGEQLSELPFPLADAHGPSGIGIGLNFSRLATLRPDYGYFNKPLSTLQDLQPAPEDDGLWRVDLSSGRFELMISLRQLALDTGPEQLHKVNHPMLSANGQECIFLHRRLRNGVRLDRLMIVNLVSGEIRELADTGMVSHMAWLDDRSVLGYLRGPDGVDGFYRIDVSDGHTEPLVKGGGLRGFGDGHPSVLGREVIWDTYPDRARLQRLYKLNLKSPGVVEELGAFFHGFAFEGESRCDLHPRFGKAADEIYFDSVCSGKRRLWRMRLRSADLA